MKYNTQIIDGEGSDGAGILSATVVAGAEEHLKQNGTCLFRGFDIDKDGFMRWLNEFCDSLTFDPARLTTSNSIQKVDSGVGAIGLHIENGNTPNVPQFIAFWCENAPSDGSSTTVCDGASVFDAFDNTLKNYFDQPLVVTRNIPFALWSRYFYTEASVKDSVSDELNAMLLQHLDSSDRHQGELLEDNSLCYSLHLDPLLTSETGNKKAFANALLGPSINYDPPRYTLPDGSDVDAAVLRDVKAISDELTEDISWRRGDLLIVDNRRVMHGRRAIRFSDQRSIFIGMGNRK